jgi:hypothetical protein
MTSAFVRIVARLAALGDDELGENARWTLLFRALELEQAAAVRARTAYRGTEAQRILGLAQLACDLRGLLAGMPADALDRAPRGGEWSARRTMEHAIAVERSYRANTAHALVRGDDEPLALPAERRPQPDPGYTAGDGSDIAERLAARRAGTDVELGGIGDDQLTRPSQWGQMDVDVRFRLHHFASHLTEHTVQVERALEAAVGPFGDGRRTSRRISQMRAMHERITPLDDLARLDAEHEARFAVPSA